MPKNTMSFKAIINNIAKENKVAAQAVLQTYMLERLLARISLSQYKDNFIFALSVMYKRSLVECYGYYNENSWYYGEQDCRREF